MTAGERLQLEDVLSLLSTMDRKIDRLDDRIRPVEEYVAGQKALDAASAEASTIFRARRALLVTTALSMAGLILSLAKIFHG